MNTEILGIILMYALVLLFAIPFGAYIGKVFNNDKTSLDRIFNPLDNLFFRWSGIDVTASMNWKQHLKALLTINGFWFLMCLFVLTNMAWLPLNPDANPSMSGDLAFNTTVSFVTNTNLQHYSGESGLSYLGQLILMLWQFISAGTGVAIFVGEQRDVAGRCFAHPGGGGKTLMVFLVFQTSDGRNRGRFGRHIVHGALLLQRLVFIIYPAGRGSVPIKFKNG